MITLFVFTLVWGLGGGTGETIRNFTEQQMAIAILIMVASDLNIICNALKK